MSSLILPRRFYNQPQGAVELDQSHRYYPYIMYCWGGPILGDSKIYGGTVSGSPVITATPAGVANDFDAAASYGVEIIYDSGLPTISNNVPLSCVALIRAKNTTDGNRYIVSGRQTNTYGFYQASTKITPLYGVSDSATGITIPDTDAFHAYAWTAKYGAGNRKSYLDGEFVASSTQGGGNWPAMAGYGIGALYRSTVAEYKSNSMLQFAVLLRGIELSQSELKDLGNNPWQLFRAKPRVLYFDAPAAPTKPTFSPGTYGKHLDSNLTFNIPYPPGTNSGDKVVLTIFAPLTSYITDFGGFTLLTSVSGNANNFIYTKTAGSEKSATITFSSLPSNFYYQVFTAHNAATIGFGNNYDTTYNSPGIIYTPSATGTTSGGYSAVNITSFHYHNVTTPLIPSSGYKAFLDYHPGTGEGTYGVSYKLNTSITENPPEIYLSSSPLYYYASTTLVFGLAASVNSGTETANGSLSFNGGAVINAGKYISASGGLILDGAATPSAGRIVDTSGNIILNGAASASFGASLALTASGSLSFNNSAFSYAGRQFDQSGSLAFLGAASESHSGAASQTNNASGSLTFNSSAYRSGGLVVTAAGTLTFAASASLNYGIVKTPSGSLLFSGNAGMSSGGPSIPGSDFNWRSRGYGR